MVKPTQHTNLEIHFRTPGEHAWAEAATQELNGANPFEKLLIRKHGLSIEPYYKKSDKNQLDFTLPASDSEIFGARAWQNMAEVIINDENKANAEALHYLHTGADGILFVVTRSGLNFTTLLADIAVEHCAVSLLLEPGCEAEAERYLQFIGDKAITGCIFYKDSTQALLSESASGFITGGIYSQPDENPIDELVSVLHAGVTLLDKFTDRGLSAQVVANQIGFYCSVDADFFLSIAKLKALRILWYNILNAYGVTGSTQLHVVSTAWIKDLFQPHGNLIKSTTAALAAIIGGCNYLTVQPESISEPGNRAARLVSNVLREEAHLAKVADPTAGSYYLNSLITQLVEKSWQQFLTKAKA
jgi:methylmalonyl-CoA mutase